MTYCFNCHGHDSWDVQPAHMQLNLICYRGNETVIHYKRKFSSFGENNGFQNGMFCNLCYNYLGAEAKSSDINCENILPFWIFLKESSRSNATSRQDQVPIEWRFRWGNEFFK